MIRPATLDDLPALLAMGERFATAANLASHVGYDADSMALTFRHMIESPDALLLITDALDGAVGGLIYPHPFNHSQRVGQELFWWSEGREGLSLFEAVEAEARRLGAVFWTMITLDAIKPEATGRLYERRGYRRLETSYIKGL
ncbi:MAG: hypothetical protein EON59_00590 [Alphaproteobacteria bacterium]|nr:MAG: hypothetical protein EON59_00590 [Alphaproteobacteria bacterium]